MSRPLRLLLLVLGVIFGSLGPSVAAAAPALHLSVVSAVNASGPSPWHGLGCMTPNFFVTNRPRVAEPAIAVNPLDPRKQSVAWIDSDAGRINAAYSTDRGRTWHKSSLPGTDPCTGRPTEEGWPPGGAPGTTNPPEAAYEEGYDPWLSYGVDGTLYFASGVVKNLVTPPLSSLRGTLSVQRARNGSDFSRPVTVPNPKALGDKPEVLADNRNPKFVYTLNMNMGNDLPLPGRADNQLLFGRSTDGGATFTTKVLADAHSGKSADAFWNGQFPQLVQLHDGTLVVVAHYPPSLGGGLRAIRSTNRGRTWSAPGRLAPRVAAGSAPTACGHPYIENAQSAQAAVFNGKEVLEVQAVNASPTGPGRIVLLRSDNAGRTWHKSTIYKTSKPVGFPSIAVSGGRIALSYDQANPGGVDCSSSGGPKVPVRSRLVVSRELGQGLWHGNIRWTKPVTIGPAWWNIAKHLLSAESGVDSYWIGDYSQITAVPGLGFAAAFAQGRPLVGPGQVPITGLSSIVVGEVAIKGHRRR